MGGDRQVGLTQYGRATASASIGSDLPRVRAMHASRPSASAAPAPPSGPRSSRSRSSRADRCRQSSIAHLSSVPNCCRAHRTASYGPSWSRERLLAQLPAHLIDRNERVGALVDISTNDNHGGCLLHSRGTVGPVGGHISVGAMPRSYQVTPAGPSHPLPAKRMDANPKAAATLRARHQMIRTQPPQSGRHPDTDAIVFQAFRARLASSMVAERNWS